MTKFRINITKDILEESKMCGKNLAHGEYNKVGINCAIGRAICKILPNSWVTEVSIMHYSNEIGEFTGILPSIPLPMEAILFIREFDSKSPEERVQMEPISFEIEVPDQWLEDIDISKALKDCETMELVV